MNGLLVVTIALGAVAGTAVYAAYVLPSRMSWAHGIRWAVNAHLSEPFGWELSGFPSCILRTAVLESVHVCGDELRVVVRGEASRISSAFVGPAPDDETVQMLAAWRVLETPMLHYAGNDGLGSLTGPAATITNLREEACLRSS